MIGRVVAFAIVVAWPAQAAAALAIDAAAARCGAAPSPVEWRSAHDVRLTLSGAVGAVDGTLSIDGVERRRLRGDDCREVVEALLLSASLQLAELESSHEDPEPAAGDAAPREDDVANARAPIVDRGVGVGRPSRVARRAWLSMEIASTFAPRTGLVAGRVGLVAAMPAIPTAPTVGLGAIVVAPIGPAAEGLHAAGGHADLCAVAFANGSFALAPCIAATAAAARISTGEAGLFATASAHLRLRTRIFGSGVALSVGVERVLAAPSREGRPGEASARAFGSNEVRATPIEDWDLPAWSAVVGLSASRDLL
jgi:hypothetical protein